MKTPTVATQSKARGSDYFNSSVTYDVQTNTVKRTLWSEITEDMDPDQDPNASTAGSSETKSVHYINETIDRDIKPSKRAESRTECQWSMCTTREEWIDQLHRLSSLSFAQCVQS